MSKSQAAETRPIAPAYGDLVIITALVIATHWVRTPAPFPNSAETHNNLRIILFVASKTRDSIPEFEAVLRLNPCLETASKNLQQAQTKLASER